MLAQLGRALAAGTIAWLLPVSMGLYVFLSGPEVDASGRPDNAPYRAAAFLLILSPLIALALGGYFYSVVTVLHRLKRLTLLTMLVPNALLSSAVGASFYQQGLEVGGVSDALFSLILFGASTFVCLSTGTAFWYWQYAQTKPPYRRP